MLAHGHVHTDVRKRHVRVHPRRARRERHADRCEQVPKKAGCEHADVLGRRALGEQRDEPGLTLDGRQRKGQRIGERGLRREGRTHSHELAPARLSREGREQRKGLGLVARARIVDASRKARSRRGVASVRWPTPFGDALLVLLIQHAIHHLKIY